MSNQTIYKQQFVMQDQKIEVLHHASILYCFTKPPSPFESQMFNHVNQLVMHVWKFPEQALYLLNLRICNILYQISEYLHRFTTHRSLTGFLEDAVWQKRQ